MRILCVVYRQRYTRAIAQVRRNMERIIKTAAAAVMALSLAACSSATSSSAASSAASSAGGEETAVYTVINATGETVKELYLYNTGESDKGDNLAADLAYGDSVELTKTVAASETDAQEYTLEFVTESGYTGNFTTLHFEVTPITLLSADAMTGATMIKFGEPDPVKAAYTIYNVTGEKVTELYLYDTGASDKGTNYAEAGLDADATTTIEIEETIKDSLAAVYTLEFVTESGYTGNFTTLHFETVPISLLSADGMTGATMIKFGAPEN